MPSYDTRQARALGAGFQAPLGSIPDPDLAARFKGYKRTVASRYRAISSEEIKDYTPPGPLLAQPKVDGELWYLVVEDGDVWLSNPGGRVVYGDIPVLQEARKLLGGRAQGFTILVGELFAVRKDSRPRHGDLARAMSGEQNAEVARVGFMAFDILDGGDSTAPHPGEEYQARLDTLKRLLQGGKRIQAMKTEAIEGSVAVQKMYDELVASGKAEGLVLRSADGRIYKLKPVFTLDAAVIGYTERADEPGVLRSMALALIREDGQYQLIGSCGNMDMDTRRALCERLAPTEVPSSFRHASNSGALYRFVRPEMVIEIKVTDIVADESDGSPVMRMVAEYDEKLGWTATRPMPSVSILHPVLLRVREDKQADEVGARMSQVSERVLVPDMEIHAEAVDRPPSKVVRREVFTKVTKGVTAVRKLVVWATNKAEADPEFPAYVVHFTDYSPGRKDPLKREVRRAPDAEAAQAIGDEILEKNIKRGWNPVES